MAKSIMIQGTGSGGWKSVLGAAFCRIFFEDGLLAALFKSHNKCPLTPLSLRPEVSAAAS